MSTNAIREAHLAAECEVLSFLRLCRRERNRRNQTLAKQTTEALRAAQSDPPFQALSNDAQAVPGRMDVSA